MGTSPYSAVRNVLEQGCLFLDRVSNDVYTRPLEGVFSGTVGAHYRHVLDHFLCLVEGIRTGEVNYDHRRRNSLLENSVEHARLTTEALIEDFEALSGDIFQRPCTVVYSVAYGESDTGSVTSNIAREVMFCVGHTIHHYAILKLLCAGAGVELPFEFGVAPSTLRHLEAATSA